MSNSNSVSISRQKLDIDQAISHLNNEKSEIDYKIKVLKRGIEELEKGEDILNSNSILAQEVVKIMSGGVSNGH
ncbi:hypothetical protein [Sphingobacterium cellulitidis]|uniref:hypothetical protein n=1 Tax=Sphingobacterium cellulitidis TaxID=1768011 RepID=UPI000B9444F0|nr:hypothetical protein CHT99_15445 [Sphingobacterium cellulitidis]